ncbi:MAG: hypothetical protein HOP11_06345 [Saprospiraceae bacterium]|nr:hypothetical protein [Saprospiraceae bacterium]
MTKTLKIVSIFLFSITNFYSQNLITNPGFEKCDKCNTLGRPWLEFFFKTTANDPVDWFAPSPGSSDIRDILTHTGKKHGGFFSIGKFEYLANILSSPLEAGSEYKFSFWLAIDSFSKYSLDEIGVNFQTGMPMYNDFSLVGVVTPYWTTPDGEHLPHRAYKQYSFNYTACGGEDHIIIGRFSGLSKGDTLFIGPGERPASVFYYTFVDDVELIKIKDAPELSPTKEVLLCEGESIRVGIKSGFVDVKWSNGGSGDSTTVKHADNFVVVEAKTSKNCPAITDTIFIKQKSLQEESEELFGAEKICFPADSFIRSIKHNYTSFSWLSGQMTDVIKISNPGTYILTSSNGCKFSTDTLEVIAGANVDNIMKFPNVITPLEMNNNSFAPVILDPTFKDLIESYELEIYNRWGKRVFESKNKDEAWRPDQSHPTETYTYLLKGVINDCENKIELLKKGTFTIIR